MTKTGKRTILKRLGTLVPDVDAICQAYNVDQGRAKKIRRSIDNLIKLVADLLVEQVELVEGQADTAQLIEQEFGRGQDAKTILNNIDVFLAGDPATVQHVLNTVFTDVFAAQFGQLDPARQVELFASLRNSINSLQRRDNILMEPEK